MKKRGALFPDGEAPAKEAAPSDEIPSEEFCTSNNNNGPTNDEELELELKEMAPPMDEQAWTGFFPLNTLSPVICTNPY